MCAYVGPNGLPRIVPTLAKNHQLKKKISIGTGLAREKNIPKKKNKKSKYSHYSVTIL